MNPFSMWEFYRVQDRLEAAIQRRPLTRRGEDGRPEWIGSFWYSGWKRKAEKQQRASAHTTEGRLDK